MTRSVFLHFFFCFCGFQRATRRDEKDDVAEQPSRGHTKVPFFEGWTDKERRRKRLHIILFIEDDAIK